MCIVVDGGIGKFFFLYNRKDVSLVELVDINGWCKFVNCMFFKLNFVKFVFLIIFLIDKLFGNFKRNFFVLFL